MQFDHVGVVTTSLDEGRTALQATLGSLRWTKEFLDPVNRVYAQFGIDASGICYELIAPHGEDSPVTHSLTRGRNILAHVAYLVADLDKESARLQATGAVATAEPNLALVYGGNRIQFFVTPMRFIIELIEAPGHQHQYSQTY